MPCTDVVARIVNPGPLMHDGIAFGGWLKQRRRALDLTQEVLAERVGCAAETIRKLEAGRRPSRTMADRLLRALAIPETEHAALIRWARMSAVPPRSVTLFPPALESPPAVRSDLGMLPESPTPLIGRAREVAEVCALLRRPAVRLLTLVGPPGIGKTRLALHCATQLQPAFDSVVVVSLAPISAPQHVGMAIAHAFGIGEVENRSLGDVLTAHLRMTTVLLVLDNVEHLLDAAPSIAELLARAPGLTIVATSRVPLHLLAEHQYAVQALALPDLQLVPPLDQLLAYAAVDLFVQRAAAAQHAFRVAAEDGPLVAEICVRLAGIPLALELAAARITFFPLPVLLKRLRQPLELLTHGARDLPTRQQTLRNAIDWSYALLDQPEQHLFQRLGVCVGGFTSDAADAVGSVGGELEVDKREGVLVLRDASLLEQHLGHDGEPRYAILALLREYAVERLEASGDAAAVRRRHAEYYLAVVDGTDRPPPDRPPEAWIFRTPAWLALVDAEHANLQAAIAWAAEHEPAIGLRLVAALWPYWMEYGYYSLGQAWAERCLGTSERDLTWHRAQALLGAGVLANWQGTYAQARDYEEASRTQFAALGEQHWVAFATNALAVVANRQGDSIAAQRLWQQSLTLCRELGNRTLTALVLNNLGGQAFEHTDYARAKAMLEESVALFQERNDTRWIVLPLGTLGDLALAEGDDIQAATYYVEALIRLRERGNRLFLAETLDGLAMAWWGQSHDVETAARATRLCGAAAALRTATNVLQTAAEAWRARYDDMISATRSLLGAEAFEAAWADGQALTLEHAIGYALDEKAR